MKAAAAKAGPDALAAACRELGLSGTSPDDIPDTKVLRELVDRLEQQAQGLAPCKTAGRADGSSASKTTNNADRPC